MAIIKLTPAETAYYDAWNDFRAELEINRREHHDRADDLLESYIGAYGPERTKILLDIFREIWSERTLIGLSKVMQNLEDEIQTKLETSI